MRRRRKEEGHRTESLPVFRGAFVLLRLPTATSCTVAGWTS